MAKSKMRKVREIRKQEKVVIAKYIRVSTDRQREEGYSVDIQKERLDNYAKSMFPSGEYDAEYREYVDDGFSGGSLERPRMTQLIEDAQKGGITHVLVLKLDRLSRSQKDTLYLIEDVFLPNNVAFISMGESFNTATAFGRAVVGILSVFAQLDRENIYERTRSGMQKRVELGYWPGGGGTPFGYNYNESKGILVPNSDAETVCRVYDLYLEGYSMQTIADMCGLVYERLVSRILTRKTYLGIISYNGVDYKGLHQPILDEGTWKRAQAMMAERSGQRFVTSTGHLLTGMVYCGRCGARMRYQKWGKAGTKLVCYSQQASKAYLIRDPSCDNPRPWADDIEAVVLDAVFRRSKEKIDDIEDDRAETQSVIRLLENRQAELNRKLKRLYLLYAEGEDEVLSDTIEELKKDLSVLDRKLEAERGRSAITAAARDTQARLDTLSDCWEHMTLLEKQNVLRSVINRVELDDNHVHIDFKY